MAELPGARQADSRNRDTRAAAAGARGYDFRTPMSAISLDTGAFVHAARNYWRAGVVGGIYFTGGFLLWGGTREAVFSSSVFLLGGVAGLWIHRRAGWTSRVPIVALILAHLLVGEVVLIWQKAHLPLSDYSLTGNPADRDFIIYLVSSLIVGTMSMFGGTLGAVLGLAAHYGFVFDVGEPITFKWAFPLLIAMAGNIVSAAFWRLDEAYERLEHLASHDALTGLLNRHRLAPEFEALQRVARDERRPLLLVAWDLDDLKGVNDARGHAAGDAHIREFADALDARVRHGSGARDRDAAFRVGGDEFLSLHLDAPAGDAVIARVHESFAAVSAGWVRCEELTLDRALSLADAALYASKDGRQRDRTTAAAPRVAAAG